MAKLILENNEEINLPNPVYFGVADDNHSLLVAFKVGIHGVFKGNPYNYDFPGLMKRLALDGDITGIKYGENTYTVPYCGSSDDGEEVCGAPNVLQGTVFIDDMLYLAIGEADPLLRLCTDDEDIADDDSLQRGFLQAIADRPTEVPEDPDEEEEKPEEPEDLNETKLFILKAEAGAFVTIANLLATHYGITDRPKGGWEVVGGNPYDKIMKELEDSLKEV